MSLGLLIVEPLCMLRAPILALGFGECSRQFVRQFEFVVCKLLQSEGFHGELEQIRGPLLQVASFPVVGSRDEGEWLWTSWVCSVGDSITVVPSVRNYVSLPAADGLLFKLTLWGSPSS